MKYDTRKLRGVQHAIAEQVKTEDSFNPGEIKYVAGFDIAFFDDKAVCAAVVLDAKTLTVVEKKHSLTKTEMPYIPGLLAFREGRPIMQTYYDLEYDPDVLMVGGHGIAHPLKAGLACYVGVELVKPTIGVAKKLLVGEIVDDKIMIGKDVRGVRVETKKYAKPVFVSPGNMVSVETAAEIVRKSIIPPHKLPEPLHQAHRHADRVMENYREEKKQEK